MSKIVPKLNITKQEYQELYDEFLTAKGYMTKLVNKTDNQVKEYLVRCEVDTINNIVVVALHTETLWPIHPRYIKAKAINTVMYGGKRKLKRLLKDNSIENIQSENISNVYKDGLIKDYVKAFEDKIKKYYNDKKVITIVVK